MQSYAATDEQIRDESKAGCSSRHGETCTGHGRDVHSVKDIGCLSLRCGWLHSWLLLLSARLMLCYNNLFNVFSVNILSAARSELVPVCGVLCMPHILADACKTDRQPQGIYAGHCQSDRGRQGMTWHSIHFLCWKISETPMLWHWSRFSKFPGD